MLDRPILLTYKPSLTVTVKRRTVTFWSKTTNKDDKEVNLSKDSEKQISDQIINQIIICNIIIIMEIMIIKWILSMYRNHYKMIDV